MARTATFHGFQPPQPDHRFFDHWRQMTPEINRTEDDTQDALRFSLCIQEVLNLLLATVDQFTAQFDIDSCSDAAVDAMLLDLGNPFAWEALDLSAIQRRKLVTYLVDIYKAKGTALGIEQTILFLLGETVDVVPYQREGWLLGVDELGSTGTIAEIGTLLVAPFDFTAVAAPWIIPFSVDGGAAQAVTFVEGDFDDPAAATAAEVVAALDARLAGAGAYVAADGAPAMVVGTATPPFSLSGGEVLQIAVQSVLYDVLFAANDFATPGSATLSEVLRVLQTELPGTVAAAHPDGGLAIYTALTGSHGVLSVVTGPAATALGLATGTYEGQNGHRAYVYSETAGGDASIACLDPSGDLSADVLGLWASPGAGTGGAILAPSEQRALYTFDIEIAGAVDATTERLIRDIAIYMKPAGTHLANVREAPGLPWPDGWVLGVSALDETTVLFEGPEAVSGAGAGGIGGGEGGLPGRLEGFGWGPLGHLPFGHKE